MKEILREFILQKLVMNFTLLLTKVKIIITVFAVILSIVPISPDSTTSSSVYQPKKREELKMEQTLVEMVENREKFFRNFMEDQSEHLND